MASRDPVSVQFDAAAGRLLRRAHANLGGWAGTYVANPSPAWMVWGAAHGMNLLGPDNASTASGLHQDARTRWCRGFIRSCYYLHKWHYYEGKGLDLGDRKTVANRSHGLQFTVGTVRISPAGLVVGRAVRIRLLPGGQRAMSAVQRLPDSARIFDDEGRPAGRWSDASGRDW